MAYFARIRRRGGYVVRTICVLTMVSVAPADAHATCLTSGGPLNCSASLGGLTIENDAASGISLPHMQLANQLFKPACVTHDYCYRHGLGTYGSSQKACDDQFLNDAQRICRSTPIGVFTIAFCEAAAQEYYAGLRKLGHKAYRTANTTPSSSFCRWLGGVEQIVHYRAAAPFVMRYHSASGKSYIHPVQPNGSIGAIVHTMTPGGGFDTTASYDSGGRGYVLMYSHSSGLTRIHERTSDGGYGGILHQQMLGGGFDQIVPYAAGGNTYLYWYSRGSGVGRVYQVAANGGLTQRATAAPGGNFDAIVPYTVAGQPYHLWYSKTTGAMKIFAVDANGFEGATPVHTGVPGPGWDQIVPYSVGSKSFLLWYDNSGPGTARVHELATNGGYGPATPTLSPGGGMNVTAFYATNGTRLLFSGGPQWTVHDVNPNGTYN